MKRINLLIPGALLSMSIAACGGGGSDSGAQSSDSPTCHLSTSFEFSASGPFCVGRSPLTASFSSGVTQSTGDADSYSSGNFAWHVLDGTSATVTFETLPTTLSFFARREFQETVGDIMVLDENGEVIEFVTPTVVLQQLVINRDSNQTLVGSVEIMSASGGDIIIDDFVWSM